MVFYTNFKCDENEITKLIDRESLTFEDILMEHKMNKYIPDIVSSDYEIYEFLQSKNMYITEPYTESFYRTNGFNRLPNNIRQRLINLDLCITAFLMQCWLDGEFRTCKNIRFEDTNGCKHVIKIVCITKTDLTLNCFYEPWDEYYYNKTKYGKMPWGEKLRIGIGVV